MRRNCCEIIMQILVKVPKDRTKFIKDLKWNFEDASYKAPEETIQWTRTMSTLIKHIVKPEEEWEFEVLHIFTTKSIEELKKSFAEAKLLYRRHRGGLEDSMKTVIEFETEEELFAIIEKDWKDIGKIIKIEFGRYAFDERTNWHTHQVIVHYETTGSEKNDIATAGYANGLPDC